MDKIERSPFAWCLLAVLLPLAANAAPVIEMRGAQVIDVADPPDSISIAFLPGEPLEVQIDEFTEVKGIVLSGSLIGTKVRLEAVHAEGGLIALDIGPGGGGASELQGIITGSDDTPGTRTITLFGYQIPVPDDADVEDINGAAILLGDIDAPVSVGGRIVDDYFEVTDVTETAGFKCLGNATHILKTLEADLTHEVAEHYCRLTNGKRTGTTRISNMDLFNPGLSTYTEGKYNQGDRHGFWITVDVKGNVVETCRYKKGKLKDGDPSCPG